MIFKKLRPLAHKNSESMVFFYDFFEKQSAGYDDSAVSCVSGR